MPGSLSSTRTAPIHQWHTWHWGPASRSPLASGRENQNSAPPPGHRLVGQATAVRLDDPEAQREAEPGPFTRLLGREERGEELGHQFRGNTRAGIPHPHHDALALAGADERDPAPLPRRKGTERVARVGDQVEQHLLQFVAIAPDRQRFVHPVLNQFGAVHVQFVAQQQRASTDGIAEINQRIARGGLRAKVSRFRTIRPARSACS